MEKEGFSGLFNSRDGKVNILLLSSTVIVVLLSLLIVEAAWDGIQLGVRTPSNLSFNGTNTVARNINFTFNMTWVGGADNGQNVSNCSLWINSTWPPIAWSTVKNVTTVSSPDDGVFNASNVAGTLSYMNYTFSADGNYTFAIACYEHNATGASLNFSANRTFFLDTAVPTITLDTTLGGVLADTTQYNITSYETATFYVNVSDNTTHTVSMILNSLAFTHSTIAPTGVNDSNRTMTAGTVISAPDGRRQFYFNLSGILNFNSSFTSPGSHSVVFCANDTFNRITCTNRSDFIIKGMNITQMENIFGQMQQGGAGGLSFGGLNITLGNGTEIPEGTFMNPIDGVTVGGLTHKNFTFIFNFSNTILVHIVGGRVDESQFANASNSRVNNTPTPEVQQQVGRYTQTMAWADIASFIPSEVSYEYGMIQIGDIRKD